MARRNANGRSAPGTGGTVRSRLLQPSRSSLARRLAEASRLADNGDLAGAREALLELERRTPNEVAVLHALLEVTLDHGDFAEIERVAEKLVRRRVDNPEPYLALFGARQTLLRPALAMEVGEAFLARWPVHDEADNVRKDLDELGVMLQQVLREVGLDDLESLRLHESSYYWLARGEIEEARASAQELIRRAPRFASAHNNLAAAHWYGGNVPAALAESRAVLELEPGNVHALANLVRWLFISGHEAEARLHVERLRLGDEQADLPHTKKAEAFSCLGDDERVLECLERGAASEGRRSALLWHFGAVAALRSGDDERARGYWRRALELDPGLSVARENLADLALPPDERHGPWAFEVREWLTPQAVQALARLSPEQGKQHATELLRRHPELVALMPALLDRAPPHLRSLMLELCRWAALPETIDALRGFVLGARGTDQERLAAATILQGRGALPRGPVRMWVAGRWQETRLVSFDVHDEPDVDAHGAEVTGLAGQAHAALLESRGAEAERLLGRALELEPDKPDLLNNLSAALELQGRHREAEAILRDVAVRFPDYFFGQVGLAQLCVRESKFDEARSLLAPLGMRTRLHISELTALARAEINLCWATDNPEGARSWLRMLQKVAPEHPLVQATARKLELAERLTARLDLATPPERRHSR